MFRLEREFKIKVPQGELFSELLVRAASEIVQDGQVTEQGLATLREQLPYADLGELERDRRLERIDDLFTVALLSSYITWKLGGRHQSDDMSADSQSADNLTTSVASTGI